MNNCPHCSETFPQWHMYIMHLELNHNKSGFTKAAPLMKRGPLTKSEKAAIVAKGEARLGLQHFYGAI